MEIVDRKAIEAIAGMKVLVFGLGILGGGAAAANWLVRHGARVTVTDLKTENELAGSLSKLEQPVKLRLGSHDEADIRDCDMVLFNPDIPVRSPYVSLARTLNKQVENEATLFYRLCRVPIIAVTGTRGKTTTCAWIVHFLQQRFSAVPAGNSPDNPFLHTLQVLEDNAAAEKAAAQDMAILVVNELPSYHLEYFQEKDRSPDVAVVTNIFQDHLNRHTSMQEYVDTKANVFRYQTGAQSLILNHGNAWTPFLAERAGSQRQLHFSSTKLPAGVDGLFHENHGLVYRGGGAAAHERVLEIPGFASRRGRHNLDNLMASALAANLAGVPWSDIQTGIDTLPEITFRQEIVFRNRRLRVVNDNAATSPDGCMAALERFGGGNCILITGGTDRELDYGAWAAAVQKRIKAGHLVFLEGTATDKMRLALADYARSSLVFSTLEQCFDAALKLAENAPNADIVFSPGAKSFEKFDNEFDRGRAFNAAVDRRLRTR